jgi:hypothetical protein
MTLALLETALKQARTGTAKQGSPSSRLSDSTRRGSSPTYRTGNFARSTTRHYGLDPAMEAWSPIAVTFCNKRSVSTNLQLEGSPQRCGGARSRLCVPREVLEILSPASSSSLNSGVAVCGIAHQEDPSSTNAMRPVVLETLLVPSPASYEVSLIGVVLGYGETWLCASFA